MQICLLPWILLNYTPIIPHENFIVATFLPTISPLFSLNIPREGKDVPRSCGEGMRLEPGEAKWGLGVSEVVVGQ